MRIRKLNAAEQRSSGFTHKIKLTYEDLTEAAANTAQVIALLDVGIGAYVKDCVTRLVTAFSDASDSAFNDVAITIGDGGAADRFLESQQINVNGTEVMAKAGAVDTMPYVYVAADTIDITFNSMALKALNDIDAGELHVFLHVVDLDDYI